MKRVFQVYQQYYVQKGLSGADFLKDVARYISARNEISNEGKHFMRLLSDFAKKVEFDKTSRF